MNQGLKAHALFKRDVDYVVKDGEVIIVDEFTGRLMPGRRWSDGLHQAVEAKENVKIESENQTLATITFQNYFRMYKKLAGMTGTADTESVEFQQIYNLDVVVIPTNRDMIRIDHHDAIYKTEEEKFDAVVEEIRDCSERGQPVLVGTVSIEKSERVSNLLKKTGIRHYVLNAKNHEREAEIVAQAGRYKAVTISTNMAGRGTDIVLGGNPEFLAADEAGTRDPNDPKFTEALARYRQQTARGARAGAGRRRPAYPGHRAPRIAAHRQPAARPFRTPGRPGLVAFLPVAGRRPAENLRRRPAQGLHGPDRDGRRHADRASLDLARDRERAEEGRSPTTSISASICSNTTT